MSLALPHQHDPGISRAVQALATKDRRESQDPPGHLAPRALQGLRLNIQSAVTAQSLERQDPEDQLDHKVARAPRDHQELTESQLVE